MTIQNEPRDLVVDPESSCDSPHPRIILAYTFGRNPLEDVELLRPRGEDVLGELEA